MVATYDCGDLFNFGYEDPRWDPLWKFAHRSLPGPPEEIEQSIRSLYRKLEAVTAAKEFSWRFTNPLLKELVQAGSGVYFFLDKKQRDRNNLVFRSHIEAELGRSIWNSAEEGIVKHLMNLVYPSIAYVSKVYINDSWPKVTEQGVLGWVTRQTPDLVLHVGQPKSREPQWEFDAGRIRVRVLCAENLERAGDIRRRATEKDFDTIIYHIHGGGYRLSNAGSWR